MSIYGNVMKSLSAYYSCEDINIIAALPWRQSGDNLDGLRSN